MKYSNEEIDQYAEQAGEAKDGFQKAIEELKADKTLSPVGKNQIANDLFNEAVEKLTELRSSYNSAIQSENDRLQIGRASCREREQNKGVASVVEQKDKS